MKTKDRNRNMNILKPSLLAAAIGLGLAGNASAVLIAYDGFDYTANANLVGLNGGTDWSDTWTASNSVRYKITSTGLSYMNLQVSGNAVFNSTTSTVRAERSFLNAPTSGSVYFSFLLNGDATTTGRLAAMLRTDDQADSPGSLGLGRATPWARWILTNLVWKRTMHLFPLTTLTLEVGRR